MFISVDLPAPFSPTSAWISPARTSRSTWSLATTPGKAFVMPRSSTARAVVVEVLIPNPPRRGFHQRPEECCVRQARQHDKRDEVRQHAQEVLRDVDGRVV